MDANLLELDELLAAVAGDAGLRAADVDDPITLAALAFIRRETDRPVSVNDVVEAASVTRRTLERRFRNTLGCTISEAITRAQVERAKRLLVETSLPVCEVALASGFFYADRLGKVFLRLEGETPSQYRARVQGNANSAAAEN